MLLPRKERSAPVEKTGAVETGGSGTVLLVEDNPDVATVSASLLEQLGYTVRRVENAEAACARSSSTELISCFPIS